MGWQIFDKFEIYCLIARRLLRKYIKGHDELDYEHSIIGSVSAMELACGLALINRSRPKMIHGEGHAEGLWCNGNFWNMYWNGIDLVWIAFEWSENNNNFELLKPSKLLSAFQSSLGSLWFTIWWPPTKIIFILPRDGRLENFLATRPHLSLNFPKLEPKSTSRPRPNLKQISVIL